MSASIDQMEADLLEQSKGAPAPSDQMEADLIAQSKVIPKTKAQKESDTQSHIRSLGGDNAAFGAGEYAYDWAKSTWNAAKNYANKKGAEIKSTGETSNPIADAAKAVGTGLWNSVGAPLFGAGARLTGYPYDKAKEAATINPSDNTAAAGELISAATKPVGEIASTPGMVTGGIAKAAGASPSDQQMISDVTNIAAPLAISKVAKSFIAAKEIPKTSAQEILNEKASAQSMGSAGAALDLSKQSPEFVAKVQSLVDKGVPLNDKGLKAQALGDRLPVKMTFTEGQALEDANKISNELNKRGTNPEIAVKRLNEQNQQLIDNLNATREKYGENDNSSNHIERGQKLIDTYSEYDTAKQADINAKYKALEDAAQGSNPIDAASIYNETVNNLQSKLKLTRAQQLPEFNELKQLAEKGEMTFDNYHTLMQDLGRVVSSGGDEAAAAKIMRDSLENMPLKTEAEGLRTLRNDATKAAKQRFAELDKDQAYNDVVNGKIQPDHFIDKYITGNAKTANKAQIDSIKQKFGNDPTINDSINTAVVERLRKEAGIDESGKGNFSQAKYNKYLQSIAPKLKSAASPDFIESLSDIGEAARLAKQLPAGHYVNTSNTATALMANVADNAGKMDIPGAKIVSKIINKYTEHKENKDIKQSFEYGAGMSEKQRMSDILKPKPKKDAEKK